MTFNSLQPKMNKSCLRDEAHSVAWWKTWWKRAPSLLLLCSLRLLHSSLSPPTSSSRCSRNTFLSAFAEPLQMRRKRGWHQITLVSLTHNKHPHKDKLGMSQLCHHSNLCRQHDAMGFISLIVTWALPKLQNTSKQSSKPYEKKVQLCTNAINNMVKPCILQIYYIHNLPYLRRTSL